MSTANNFLRKQVFCNKCNKPLSNQLVKSIEKFNAFIEENKQ